MDYPLIGALLIIIGIGLGFVCLWDEFDWGEMVHRKVVKLKPARFTVFGHDFDSDVIDLATGFPKVPRGWTWHVKIYDEFEEYFITVALFDTKKNYRTSDSSFVQYPEQIKAVLLPTAQQALRDMQNGIETRDAITSLSGTYPPKELK